MKILIVQPFALGPGHYDAYTKRLCEGLYENKAQVTLLTAAGTKDCWEERMGLKNIRVMSERAFFLFRLNNSESNKAVEAFLKRARLVVTGFFVESFAFREFETGKYDVVHFIDSEPVTLSLLFFIHKKPKNVFATVPAPYFFDKKKNLVYRFIYDPLRRFLTAKFFKYAQPIVHSDKVKNSLVDLKIITEGEMPVIPWGVDKVGNIDKRAARNKLSIKDNHKVFGFFGYILDHKGFFLTLEAWKLTGEDSILLAYVHSDHPEDEKKIKEFIKKEKLDNKILLKFGYVAEEDLLVAMDSCDAVLLPYHRGFQGESGIMSLAVSRGIPIIASNVGKIGATVSDNKLGILFEPDSPSLLSEAIKRFSDLKEPEILAIKAMLKSYADSLSWREVACQHVRVYKFGKIFPIERESFKILVCAYACQLKGSLSWAGPGEMILGWNIISEISKKNKVWVITHSYNKPGIESELSINPNSNLNFCYVKLPSLFNFLLKFEGGIHLYAYLWQIRIFFAAKKLHKKNNFEIYHHATFANDWMASYIGAFLSIPYIRGPGGGAHRVPKTFVKEFSLKEKVSDKLRVFGQWVFRHDPVFILSQNKARKILICNQEAFNGLKKKWQTKAIYFPVNGISKDNLNLIDKAQKLESEDFIVLTAGKLLKIKKFDLALRAFKRFNERNLNSKMIIIGDGPEEDNLRNLSTTLGLGEKVIFRGWLDRESLFKEMVNCDVFLFASLRDGGGAVIVEAMAAGKPVVCFDIAGPGFNVREDCGIKIKPISPEFSIMEMVEALNRLSSSKKLLDEKGINARERAKDFEWENLGRRLQKIYHTIYDNKK